MVGLVADVVGLAVVAVVAGRCSQGGVLQESTVMFVIIMSKVFN